MVLVAGEEHDERMYLPGGIVDRWVHGVASELFFYMRKEVPVNKRVNKTAGEPEVGTLSNLIYADVDRFGPRQLAIDAGSRAYYAGYVVGGTSTIYNSARNERGQFAVLGEGVRGGMYLPANPGYGPPAWRAQVRGQKANNFIGRAYDATARLHPALKGVSME